MKKIQYREIEGGTGFWLLLAGLGVVILAGLLAVVYKGTFGHHVTGMNNQVVWGLPHVFAILLIVAASGALNVASISSAFGKTSYKPLAPLSGLLAITLLLGGLVVLVLDLGRSDRLIVAMTYYNFKSIFAWNIILYNGFLVIVAAYLWTMMERRMNRFSKPVGIAAFLWRLILTTGTGSIFGFLVARDAYNAALLAPQFIAMSFALGLAVYLLVLMCTYRSQQWPLGSYTLRKLKKLLVIFIAASFYFVAVYHLTNLYIAQSAEVTHFVLFNGGLYSALFWFGQIVVGTLIPLAILLHPTLGTVRQGIAAASILVLLGGTAQLYVLIIGGQAFPLQLFPGMEVSSSFYDGVVASYNPSLIELFLGLGGVALFLAMTVVALRVMRFLPASLADEVVDPHYQPAVAVAENTAKTGA